MGAKHKKVQVVIVAIDPKRSSFNLLLLQTNKVRKEFWQNVTGTVEEGETFEEAALREALEETGLALEAIVDFVDLKLTHEFTDQRDRKCLEKSFLLILDHEFPVQLDPSEHQSSHWLALETATPESVKHLTNFESIEKSRNLLRMWGHA